MKIPDFKEFISPSSDIAFAAARRIMEILSEFYPLSDLSKALIIVPTRSAARALHRNINSYLMQSGNSAVGGIRIFTQETLIGEIVRKVSFANVFESYNAWFKSFDSFLKSLSTTFRVQSATASSKLSDSSIRCQPVRNRRL